MSVLIPFTNDPMQTLSVKIPLGSRNINLHFTMYFNQQAGYWMLDIANADDETVLLAGLPMLTAYGPVADLLYQYKHLNIGSAYLVKIGPSDNDSPGVSDWGTAFVLEWDV